MCKIALLTVLALALTPSLSVSLSDKPYLTAGQVDFLGLVAPPPSEDSPAGKRDLQTILDLQQKMAPELMAAIQADTELTVYRVAGEVLGPNFAKARFPLAAVFFAKINEEKAIGVGAVKEKYKRLRPFQYSKDVKTPENITKDSNSATYPSGHCTFGAEAALLLGMMAPEKRVALYTRAREYDLHRITSGAAFPSDCEAGHIVATLIVNQMMKNPAFRADYEAVKAEVRKGLQLP